MFSVFEILMVMRIVNGNEEPRWRELSPIQFSYNCNYSLITHNKTPVRSTWGLLRVCVLPDSPS